MLKKFSFNKNEKIDISDLANGVYFVIITNKNNAILHKASFIKD